MASRLIGIAFTSDSLHLALVQNKRILTLSSTPLPLGLIRQGRVTDPSALAAILANTLKSQRIRCRKCALVLPRRHTLGLHLTLPDVPGLPGCFRDYVDGDPEKYDYDYVVTDRNREKLYAVAIPREIPEEYAQVCRRAGLIPVLGIPSEMAWGNLIRHRCGLPEKLAVIDWETDISGLYIFHRGNFVLRHELEPNGSDPAAQITKIINLYNFSLSPEEALLRDLYGYPADMPDTGSWQLHPMGDLLEEPSCAPAAGAALQGTLDGKTMNFIHPDAGFDLRRVLPAAIAAGLALLLFAQFGILKPLQQKALAYEKLSQKQEQLEKIQTQLEGFSELEQQYLRYGTGLMAESEAALVSRPAVLELVETALSGHAALESLVVNQNILTLCIRDVTLEEAGSIVSLLEANPLVSAASIQSAAAGQEGQSRILLTVTLANPNGKEA